MNRQDGGLYTGPSYVNGTFFSNTYLYAKKSNRERVFITRLCFVEELYSVLETDPDKGLSTERATVLLEYHGYNALTPATQSGWVVLLFRSLFTGKIHMFKFN